MTLSPCSQPLRSLPFILLALMAGGCGDEQVTAVAEPRNEPVLVETLTLSEQAWRYNIESFGQLRVADSVNIGVQGPGTIEQLQVREGQQISAGELLFSLDDKKQKLRHQQAIAAAAEAKTQLSQAQQSLGRFQSLRQQRAISEDQLLQAHTNFEAADARLLQALASLSIAKTELAERRILSPVNGVIESESIERGQHVQPGQTLLIIQADGAMQVSAHVNEYEVQQLLPTQQATATIAGRDYRALIESIGRSASPHTGNYEIKLRIQGGEQSLREGMSAQVRLPVTSNREVILLPRNALVDRHRKRVVFVLQDGRAESRTVQFGLPNKDSLPVLTGLETGDRVIVSPLRLITDGIAVTAIEVTASLETETETETETEKQVAP